MKIISARDSTIKQYNCSFLLSSVHGSSSTYDPLLGSCPLMMVLQWCSSKSSDTMCSHAFPDIPHDTSPLFLLWNGSHNWAAAHNRSSDDGVAGLVGAGEAARGASAETGIGSFCVPTVFRRLYVHIVQAGMACRAIVPNSSAYPQNLDICDGVIWKPKFTVYQMWVAE